MKGKGVNILPAIAITPMDYKRKVMYSTLPVSPQERAIPKPYGGVLNMQKQKQPLASTFLRKPENKSVELDYDQFLSYELERSMAKVLSERTVDKLGRLTKERKSDKKVRIHVKTIRDHIVKDFMARQLRVNNKTLALTQDTQLKECIDLITKASDQTDHKTISPFYLTYNQAKLKPRFKPRRTTIPSELQFQRNKGNTLYANFIRNQWANSLQPKNQTNYLVSAEKLANIRGNYRNLAKNARVIQRFSRKKCNNFKKDWVMCEKILHEVNKGQEKFEDPEVNFGFYIWQASKLCDTEGSSVKKIDEDYVNS